MRVAIANQKGGVGKTTTAVNLVSSLAERGYRCLLVDLDPQANATTGLGIDHRDLRLSTYDVVIDGRSATEAIIETGQERLHLLPSAIDLAGAELELVPAMARESKLRHGLEGLVDQYDVVLIDCPPSLGLLTVNALTAADRLLIPIQCEYYALEGLTQLLRNIELVRSGLNARLEIGAIVLTMYDARTKLSEQVADEIRQHFPDRVFSTVIPRSVRLSEAPSYGQPAVTYDPSSRGSMAYSWLAEEFEARVLEPGGVRPVSRSSSEREPMTGEDVRSGGEGGVPTTEESSPQEPVYPKPQVSENTTMGAVQRTDNHDEWFSRSAAGSEGTRRPETGEVGPRPADPDGSLSREGPSGGPEGETEERAGHRGASEEESPPPRSDLGDDEPAERRSAESEDDAEEGTEDPRPGREDTQSEKDVDEPWSYRGEREGW